MNTRDLLPVLAVAAALAAVQLLTTVLGVDYYLTQLTMSAYYSLVVLGLCLVMGYAGQVSLGHAAFFAIGGYTSAVLTTRDMPWLCSSAIGRLLQATGAAATRPGLYGGELTTLTPWAAFACAILLATFAALLIGYPALRLKGHYLAMATLGFGLIVYRLLLGSEFTGSADGITGVPPWDMGFGVTLSSRKALRIGNYYFAWGITLLVLLLLLNLVRGRIGRALRSLHDGELAADAMGVNTGALKLKAFVLSALLAAAAGCFMTHYTGGIGPSEAGVMKSVRYVALVAAGGMANLWGALVISALLTFLSLRGCFGTFDHAVFGVILIAIVSLAPEGPLRPISMWLRRSVKQNAREPQIDE